MSPGPDATTAGAGAALAERAQRVVPGGVNSGQRSIPGLPGLVVAGTGGARFRTADGAEFTDYHAAFGPPLLGHNDPDVARAAAEAGAALGHMGVGVTEGEIELAEELCALVPSLEKVLLTSTGSEATFHALRVARAATGRRLVVKFQGCYHGWHDSVSLNVISAPERVGGHDPISAGILPEVLDATLVLPFNDSAAVRRCFAEHGADIAAVIVEPVPHNVGALLPHQEFLTTLREETAGAGSVLVFDEVITGVRHSLGGWQQISGVTPDLTTLGKAIANGAPAGAIGGRADLMELFSTRPGAPAFFALLLFVLGLGLAIQVRSTGESSALRGARQEDLVRILDELDDRTQRLEDERERLEDQKAELENSSDQAEEARRQTEAKQRQLGVLAGTVAAEGPGIEITVRGPAGAVEADMLLDTIQELRAAGAEAIQINGVRVVAGTHFADSGENDVAIDGRTVSQPYVFRVIGRAEDLEPALNIPGGVVQTMEEEQATVSIEPRDTVLVDALRREKRPDYARSSS
ncbi:aminotransferase class III-fold pyridoxal phosphate-dependent enzyme [Streptomyces phytophilus]|uniref:aminotransferase class III-fold pyridoxal phosphate-dependent enzyme n=1 Tax=Streptomyces phytophilus TaxID=722715 RepID=UPI00215DB51F